MRNRTISRCIIIAVYVAVLGSCMASSASLSPDKGNACPNIVFILADDMGYGDPQCNNPESKIPTPNMDRLAREGIRFTDAHSPSSVCTPTRYSILTGRYAWRSRLKKSVLWAWDKPLIETNRLTVPSMLKQQGYTTACIGKWHLGWDWPTKDGSQFDPKERSTFGEKVDFTQPIKGGPLDCGFDYYFGDDVPNFPPYCFIENDRLLGIPSENKPNTMFGAPGPMLPGWKLEEVMPTLTTKAIDYIRTQAKQSPRKPFFLYFALTAPHTPIVPAKEFTGKSQAGQYGDYVYQVDWTIGQVLDELRKQGLEDNTLVIVTSDNGSPGRDGTNAGGQPRSVNRFGHNPSDGLRGIKADAWDGGHRIPFIARWPGRIKPGSVSDETICLVDFMATMAFVLNVTLPDNAAEDSYNILPALLSQSSARPIREATVHHSINGVFCIRQGNWKYIDGVGSGGWSGKGDGLPGQLYNMETDLDEKNNLYESPDHQTIIKELKALLEQYKKQGYSRPRRENKDLLTVESFHDRLIPKGFVLQEDDYHIWCNAPVYAPDGTVHLYVSRWPISKGFTPGWYKDCEIAHYKADAPEGPYTYVRTVLKGDGKDGSWRRNAPHNVSITPLPDGRYAMVFIANGNFHKSKTATGTREFPASQKIGMMIADNLDGPWTLVGDDGLMLDTPSDPDVWSYDSVVGVNNPTLLPAPDGRFLLYYKAMKKGDIRRMGVVVADKVEGPYRFEKEPLSRNQGTIEDGFAFLLNGEICLLVTDCHGEGAGGGMIYRSNDGINFDSKAVRAYEAIDHYMPKWPNPAPGWSPWVLQRPALLIDASGIPTHLYAPCGTPPEGRKGTGTFMLEIGPRDQEKEAI